jgi:hypothetical protein
LFVEHIILICNFTHRSVVKDGIIN